MTMRLAFCALVASITFLSMTAISDAATSIGKVVAVLGSPSASGPGGDRALKAGGAVFEDDKITVRNGNAQIILNDNTRLVVGPGSTLVLEKFLMKGGNTAQKVSIKALRGTFRFITGRSAKKAYDIQTASATVGIRGTAFDCWVRGETGCAVLQGVVNLSSGKKSVNLQDDCEVGRAGGGKAVELGLRVAGQNINQNLPYILNQLSLRPQFRLEIRKCDAALDKANAGQNEGGGGGGQEPQGPQEPQGQGGGCDGTCNGKENPG